MQLAVLVRDPGGGGRGRDAVFGKRLGDTTHYLLYLNERTFLHEAGEALAAEVRSVMDTGMPILMLHENDPKEGRDGCEFATFFRTTPDDLIQSGLYSKLAIAALPARPSSSS